MNGVFFLVLLTHGEEEGGRFSCCKYTHFFKVCSPSTKIFFKVVHTAHRYAGARRTRARARTRARTRADPGRPHPHPHIHPLTTDD